MKRIASIFIALCFVLMASAQRTEISVMVSPNHHDWKYELNEKCTFTIQVLKAQNPMTDADITIDYELGPEMYPTETKQGVVLKNGILKLTASMKQPGFLRCKVRAHVNGRAYSGMATAAYAADRLQPISTMPDDFAEYWAKTMDEARKLPLKPQMRLMPERCTELDNVYEVNFQTKRGGGRFYGILTVPKAEGKYPALLRVPGAGIRPYGGDTYTAPGKLIVLEVGIHGIPVTMENEVYNAVYASSLNNYWTFRWDDRNEFYYNRVIVGVLRSVDFLCSLPQYNGKALGVAGSSQGGYLSLVAAALDNRITCLAPMHPAFCDIEAYFAKRACGWPHYFPYYNIKEDKNVRNNLRYYDGVNMARLIKVPGWYTWGYNDDVCPPTSMYAAYNVITAPKTLSPYVQTGHNSFSEQQDEWQKWLRKQLGID